MKNIEDNFKKFVKAHEALIASMSNRIHCEFLIVEIDGKIVFAYPTQFVYDWKELIKNAKFYRSKGHSVSILKKVVNIKIHNI